MRRTRIVVFYALVFATAMTMGCGGSTDEAEPTLASPPTPSTTDTADTGAGPSAKTGYYASFYLADQQPDVYWTGHSDATAMFVNDTNGQLNPAGCLGGLMCVESLPTEGMPAPGYHGLAATGMDFIEADPVTVGQEPLVEVSIGISLYYGAPSFSGTVDVGFAGDLVPWEGSDLIPYPDPIQMTAPDVEAKVRVSPGDTIELEWVTGGEGDVYLDDGLLLHRLADDGAHTVLVDDLALSGPIDAVELQVLRLNAVEVDGNGNQVSVIAATSQGYGVDFLDPGPLPELAAGTEVADACEDAAALSPMGPGSYWFDKRGFSDALDPGAGNSLTGREAPGTDALVRVDLTAGQQLTATLTYADGDESLYLLTDPCDIGTGLVGADQESWNSPSEEVVWTATGAGPVYVVLDEASEYAELGTLTLDIQ